MVQANVLATCGQVLPDLTRAVCAMRVGPMDTRSRPIGARRICSRENRCGDLCQLDRTRFRQECLMLASITLRAAAFYGKSWACCVLCILPRVASSPPRPRGKYSLTSANTFSSAAHACIVFTYCA